MKRTDLSKENIQEFLDEYFNDKSVVLTAKLFDGDNVGIYKDKEGKIRIFKDTKKTFCILGRAFLCIYL